MPHLHILISSACTGLPNLPPLLGPRCLPRSELAVLQGLQQLEEVDLGWCSCVGDSDAAVLATLPRLQALSLARTQVSAPAVALTRLTLTDLPSGWRLDGNGMEQAI